jgi:F0F1-type ATP synthase assembly protein I
LKSEFNVADKPDSSPTLTKAQKQARDLTQMSSIAFEVPFTFVGAVFLGGLIGYYLDRWLHTGPWLMVLFGGFGFAGGIIEIVRRFGPGAAGTKDDDTRR